MAHFDSKAEVEELTRSLGVPATFFYAGAYMSNIPGAMQKVMFWCRNRGDSADERFLE